MVYLKSYLLRLNETVFQACKNISILNKNKLHLESISKKSEASINEFELKHVIFVCGLFVITFPFYDK